jgi:7-cyano-7-deazaguanine tRNA-ribosyltransferase
MKLDRIEGDLIWADAIYSTGYRQKLAFDRGTLVLREVMSLNDDGEVGNVTVFDYTSAPDNYSFLDSWDRPLRTIELVWETVSGSELPETEPAPEETKVIEPPTGVVARKGEIFTDDPLDIQRALAVARYQFGLEAAEALFRGKIELRKSKKTGKIRNVISDGEHVLSMRAGDGLYTLRIEGAQRILAAVPAPHMRMAVTDDSVPFVSQGRNAMCQFTTACDPDLVPMDEVIVVDKDDRAVATGRMLLVADEIFSMKKGIAVKIRTGSEED